MDRNNSPTRRAAVRPSGGLSRTRMGTLMEMTEPLRIPRADVPAVAVVVWRQAIERVRPVLVCAYPGSALAQTMAGLGYVPECLGDHLGRHVWRLSHAEATALVIGLLGEPEITLDDEPDPCECLLQGICTQLGIALT